MYKLMELQKSIVNKKLAQKIGKTYEILVERHEGDYYVGRSYESAPDDVDSYVYIQAQDINIGDFVQVKIVGYNEYDLIAIKI